MCERIHSKQTALQISRMRMMDVVLAVGAVVVPVGTYFFALRAAPEAAKIRLGPVLRPDAFPFLKLMVVAAFAAPLVVVGLLAAKFWVPTSWRTFALAAILVTGTSFGYFVGFERGAERAWAVRRQILHELAARSEPVVMAVDAYVRANHRPPARWSNLVPAFLPEEPATGIATHPRFDLIVEPSLLNRHYGGNPWAIRLDIFGSGAQRWDELLFLPLQNYGDLGSEVVPAGRWALRGS
ncbi:MAG: hypothetical protein U1G08_04430 [Verrucomicrobiota bacterium]